MTGMKGPGIFLAQFLGDLDQILLGKLAQIGGNLDLIEKRRLTRSSHGAFSSKAVRPSTAVLTLD